MPQLRFITSLCLPISLIYGQIVSTDIAYASYEQDGPYTTDSKHLKSKSDSDEDIEMAENTSLDDYQGNYIDIEIADQSVPSLPRQRFNKSLSETTKDQEDDKEKKAERKLQLDAFRKENKGHLDDFVKYGMLGLFLTASTNMLWNIEHSPGSIRSSWTYTEEEWVALLDQQNTFTNSGAFSTLQYSFVGLTIATLGKSIHALWQIRDSLPSSTELRIKGKAFAWDAWWVGVYGLVSTGLRGLPQLWKFAKTGLTRGKDRAYFKLGHGSTNFEKLSEIKVWLGMWSNLFGGVEISCTHRLFNPASKKFKRYVNNPPEEFKAKSLDLDLSGLEFSLKDFAFFITFNNIAKLDLRNCDLTDRHVELLYYLASSSIKELDIRENPKISAAELQEIVVRSLVPQNVRGIYGFENMNILTIDARDDLINQHELLTCLALPARRRIKSSGELTRKKELSVFFDRYFYYFKQTESSDFFPPEFKEIIEQNKAMPQSKERFKAFYKEKNFSSIFQVSFQKDQREFETESEIITHIEALPRRSKINACFLVKTDLKNRPLLYVAPTYDLQSSSREKDYILTAERVFRKIPYVFTKTDTDYLIQCVNDARLKCKNISYVIEYEADGNLTLYVCEELFVYHNKNDIWFTPSNIYLPSQFRDNHDLRIYLSNRHGIYKIAELHKLMEDSVQDIRSFITMDLRQETVVLAEEFKHFSKNRVYLPSELRAQGLLTEVNLIQTLVRCNFLKSLQFEVIDNSWV